MRRTVYHAGVFAHHHEGFGTMDNSTRNGFFFILASSIGYAGIPIFTKFIYLWSDMHPLDVATWRFFIAVPLLWLAVSVWMRNPNAVKLTKPLPRLQLMLSGVLLMGAALTAFFGLQYVDASLFVVLFFSYPAMTGLIMAVLGEPLPWRGWVALVMTTIGVVLTAPDVLTLSLSGDMLYGVLIALLNALLVAVFMIWSGYIQRGYPTSAWSSAWSLTGTLFVAIPLVLVRGVGFPPDLRMWLLMFGLCTFSTVLPVFSLLMGVRLLGAGRAAILGTLEPVLAVFLAFLLLGERLLWIQIVGAVFIIASIIVLEAPMPRRKKAIVHEGA